MTWISNGQDGSNNGIFGQLFTGNGSKIGSEFQANTYTTNNQRYPSVASFSNGNFVVTWASSGQDGSGDGVYGQLFNDLVITSSTATSTTFTTSTASSTTLANSSRSSNSLTPSTLTSLSTSMPITISTRLTSPSTSTTSTTTLANSSGSSNPITPSTLTSLSTSMPITTSIASMSSFASSTRLTRLPTLTILSPTTSISHKASSPKRTRLVTIISLGAGGLICFCLTPLGFLWLRKRKAQTGTRLSEETGISSTAFELRPVIQKYKVIGETYYQLSTLVREEAEAIYLQTGHLIPFPEGQKKFSYVIGSGQFGKIKVAQRIEDKQYVASKKVKGEENMRASEAEAQMQKAAAGDNVLPIYNTIRLENALYHFMPLAGLGDGSTIQRRLALLNHSPLALTIFTFIAQNILTGLQTIHAKAIYHLDIKPDNLVFTKDGTAYITDFGCAQRPESRHLTREALGDNRYFSPERLQACQRGTFDAEKADMWAAGVTLLQIFYNKGPLEILNMPHRLNARVEKCDQAHFDEQLQQLFDKVEKGNIWWVIKGLLDTNPKMRFTAMHALQARCFRGLSKTQQESTFEELRRETFAHHRGIETTQVDLDNYGWVMQRVPEEERTQPYSSEQNRQFYGYTLTPDIAPPDYQRTPDFVTASSASSGDH